MAIDLVKIIIARESSPGKVEITIDYNNLLLFLRAIEEDKKKAVIESVKKQIEELISDLEVESNGPYGSNL